jgi:hypothetical protein
MERIREVPALKVNGFVALIIVLVLASIGGWQAWSVIQGLGEVLGRSIRVGDLGDVAAELGAWLGGILIAVVIPSVSGFFTVEPNQAVVLVFLGRYVGSVRQAGFWWTNPFASRRRVSCGFATLIASNSKSMMLRAVPLRLVLW